MRFQRERSNSLPSWDSSDSTYRSFGTRGKARLSVLNSGLSQSISEHIRSCSSCTGGQKLNGKLSCDNDDWWETDCDDDRQESCDTVDFALQTSLHGLKYIFQPRRHIIERIFWLISFTIGLVMAGWLISNVWLKYLSSPLIVTFQPFETTIDKIPFPAITICNMNKVQKSRAEEYIRLAQGPEDDERTIEARKNVYYLDHVCSSSKSFSQKFNYSTKRGHVDKELLEKTLVEDGDDEQRDVAQFLQIASQPCSEMLLLCTWQDRIYNCSDLFKPIETDFGKCCVFNMIPHMMIYNNLQVKRYDSKEKEGWLKWEIEKNGLLMKPGVGTSTTSSGGPRRLFPRRQKKAGKSSGLSVLLNPDLDEYFCTSSDSHGFQLLKHLPIDIPTKVVDFGIAVRPNSEVFMGIRPEITMVDRGIRNFKLEKRNCYFYGEYKLAYYKHYTSSNCYDECLANQTYELCGCVSYFMPRDDSRNLCGETGFSCAENVRNEALLSGIKSQCDYCLPACTEIEYLSETTFTPIQPASEMWITDSNVMPSWANKSVSIVHIYFSTDSTYARVRKQLYGITDLIGGKYGRFDGIVSWIQCLSLVELIYFYTLRAWCRSRAWRRGNRMSLWAVAKMKLQKFWVKCTQRDQSQSSQNVNMNRLRKF